MSFNGTIEVSCSDSDFYQRKIVRLEDDISILHQELAKVRTRLRIAEDFEIKYHILLESSQRQIQQLKDSIESKAEQRASEKQGEKLKENEYKWQKKLKELEESLNRQANKQLSNLADERDSLKRKVSELSARKQEIDLFNFKVKKLEKENQQLQEQLDELRVHYEQKIGDQLDNLRLHLNSSFRERLNNERKAYETKLSALEKKMLDQLIVKDENTYKPAVAKDNGLMPLKQMLEEHTERHNREIQELDGFIQQKNIQIKQLLQQKTQREEKHREDIHHRENIISQLQSTLLQKEKQHQEQITTILTQTTNLKEQQIAQLAEQIEQLRNQNANQKKWWSDKLINHDKQIQNLTNKFEEEIQRISEQKNDLKLKIVQLTDRLKQYEGDKAAGETQQLLASLNNLQQKEANMSNYEDGITFLQGQLARCQKKLEEQARALRTANKELSQIRADAAKQSATMFQTIINQKEEHSKQINLLERQINELNQQLRNNQRELKRYQRQIVTQQHNSGIEISQLKYALEEVQRDYKRAVQSNKENSLNKAQFDKVTGQDTSYQKIKWLELEKQKNQIEAIYRQKEEQLRLKYDEDLQIKAKELVLLKRQSQIADKEIEMLQKENNQLREQFDLNKENYSANLYHNKLATINLELALAQNIYDKILKAKCRGNEPQQSTYRSAEPYRQGEEESFRRDQPIEPSSYRSSQP